MEYHIFFPDEISIYYPNQYSDKVIKIISIIGFKKEVIIVQHDLKERYEFKKDSYTYKIYVCRTGVLFTEQNENDINIPDSQLSVLYNEERIQHLINFLKMLFKNEFRVNRIKLLIDDSNT